jgi:hypothetical protein
MSRTRKTTIVMVIATAIAGAGLLSAQPKGQRATIKGEVVDLWCYLEGGDRGPAKKDCATACARSGNPIGLLDAKGNLYLAAGLKDHEPAQAMLLGKMSEEVTVTGTLVKTGGLQMIYVDSVTDTRQIKSTLDRIDEAIDVTVDRIVSRFEWLSVGARLAAPPPTPH